MAQHINPFLLDIIDDLGPIEVPPGDLEYRYLGKIGKREDQFRKNLIRSMKTYPQRTKQQVILN
jgi:hypothetical protein